MKKYRKKPLEVEAIQFTDNAAVLAAIPEAKNWLAWLDGNNEWNLDIPTPEGFMTDAQGSWIIKGIEDEFYPCKASIFDATYEEA